MCIRDRAKSFLETLPMRKGVALYGEPTKKTILPPSIASPEEEKMQEPKKKDLPEEAPKTQEMKPECVQSDEKDLSLIHISEPTRPLYISYAVFCLKKKKNYNNIDTYNLHPL
eukprot:TRINITY_DN21304_c0_g1_i1.p4 TRINITY_DN21304_c0_g1~~TRINITY_DN21304_c0_g1_i1.p4  ORF type:complete len:113 (+),score=39.58 TRINITY_DN21304_c0_g1_i1:131-469(+)